MTTNVMQEIAAFEQAQKDYARQKEREGIALDLANTPEAAAQLVANKVESFFQKTNSVYDALTAIRAEVAADLDVDESEFIQETQKRSSAFVRQFRESVEDTRRAYAEKLSELSSSSAPFDGTHVTTFNAPELTASIVASFKSDLTNFMLQAQLTGGLPKNREGIAEAVKAAIQTKDAGALQFWHKNFETLYRNTGEHKTLHLDEDVEALMGTIDAAVDSFRGPKAKDSAKKLRAIKAAWPVADKALNRAEQFLGLSGNGIPGDADNWGFPQRSTEQRTEAARRAAIRRKRAEIANLGG